MLEYDTNKPGHQAAPIRLVLASPNRTAQVHVGFFALVVENTRLHVQRTLEVFGQALEVDRDDKVLAKHQEPTAEGIEFLNAFGKDRRRGQRRWRR